MDIEEIKAAIRDCGYEVHELEMENKMSEQPTEEETLGKLAYETFLKKRNDTILVDDIEAWENTGKHWQDCWIAAAKAVAERVIAKMQTAGQALSLLAWLEENKPALEKIAKENNPPIA